MSKSVKKLIQENHNTKKDFKNENMNNLRQILAENDYKTRELKETCVGITNIIERLKFLRKYVSKAFVTKEKKKVRSIYHLFKEKQGKKEINFYTIKKHLGNIDYMQLWDLNHEKWNHIAEACRSHKNTCYSAWFNTPGIWNQLEPDDDIKILQYSTRIDDWVDFACYMQKSPFLFYKRYKEIEQRTRRDTWTKKEDLCLKEAIKQYGVGKWILIANKMRTKGPTQCMHRYRNKLIEGIRTGRWMPEEDHKLREAVSIFGKGKWARISEHVGTRNDSQCRERYCNILDPDLRKGNWEAEEDKKLVAAVMNIGEGNWSLISEKIHGRTDAQCRRRYASLSKK